MAQLDGNSAAAGDHSHVVIDIGAAGDGDSRRRSSSSCAVCTEPLEWAAIGPCGHGDVCAGCSLRIRVFQNNRRCCICRAPCRVVVVTKHVDAIAAAAAGGGGGWRAVSSRLPRSQTGGGGYSQVEGRVGEHWWYHAGMRAFFDDERQYAAATAAARPPSCGKASDDDHRPPQARSTSVGNEQHRISRRDPPDEHEQHVPQFVEAVLIGLLVVAAVGLVVLIICVRL
uniref:RING-type domain-containing protein n=1 Tax=Oryza nivara TaxID=4536 RepID=A0A0E0I4I2_ORYNI